MRFQISILTFLVIPIALLGQDLKTVKEFRSKQFSAYVFAKEHDHQTTWEIKDKTDYFTPDSLAVVKAEKEIIKQAGIFKSIKGRQKALSNFDRQYLGYHRQNGDSVLIISFINTDKGKKAKELKKSIDKDLIFGFGDWYEKNTFRLTYNLRTSELRDF
jgi:hypothetical protein